jgi:hypothetical protein
MPCEAATASYRNTLMLNYLSDGVNLTSSDGVGVDLTTFNDVNMRPDGVRDGVVIVLFYNVI